MNIVNNDYEVKEIVRTLEKYGLSEILITADGTLSPAMAVNRICQFFSDADLLFLLQKSLLESKRKCI